MAAKRKCSGTTKAGKPCQAPPLKDRDVCLVHSDPETRKKAQFLPGGNGKGGRPRKPKAVEVLRERLEGEAEALMTVFFDAAKAIDRSGDPDHQIRLKAVEALLDRAYGKPGQSFEVTGAEGGPIVSTDVDDPEVRKLAAKLLRRRVEASDDPA